MAPPVDLERKAKAPQLPQLKFPSRSSINEFYAFLSPLQGQSSAQDLVKLFSEALVSMTGLDMAISECLPDYKAIAATFYTCLANRLGLLFSRVYEVSAPF